MYGFSDDETPRWLSLLSIALGTVTGALTGTALFLFATLVAALFGNADPAMSPQMFLALWCALIAIPVFCYARLACKPEALPSGRAFAGCAACVIAVLFAGELTGITRVYPWHLRLYVVPGVYDRPIVTPAPVTR